MVFLHLRIQHILLPVTFDPHPTISIRPPAILYQYLTPLTLLSSPPASIPTTHNSALSKLHSIFTPHTLHSYGIMPPLSPSSKSKPKPINRSLYLVMSHYNPPKPLRVRVVHGLSLWYYSHLNRFSPQLVMQVAQKLPSLTPFFRALPRHCPAT